jgi:hypothetical protein
MPHAAELLSSGSSINNRERLTIFSFAEHDKTHKHVRGYEHKKFFERDSFKIKIWTTNQNSDDIFNRAHTTDHEPRKNKYMICSEQPS